MQDYRNKQTVLFTLLSKSDWRNSLPKLLNSFKGDYVDLDFKDFQFGCKDIIHINKLCEALDVQIACIYSELAETIVSAKSLGFKAQLHINILKQKDDQSILNLKQEQSNTLFHKGTLRSGEILESDEDILIIGDVNPGSKVIAGGNVMIWGRLLGIAHAGKYGNEQAKITALQLRPVQLRIAKQIARGPSEKPELGLAEQATIENGIIVIKPAKTNK